MADPLYDRHMPSQSTEDWLRSNDAMKPQAEDFLCSISINFRTKPLDYRYNPGGLESR